MIISILGCGWLGFPLAKQLIARTHRIKGSTTSKNKINQLKHQSIEPYLIELNPLLSNNETENNFWNSDVLVLNIPPGRGRNNIITFHTSQIRSVIQALAGSSISHVVFISSTSVYPKYPGVVTEADVVPGKAGRSSGNALLQAEQLLFNKNSFDTTVLRFGGLYGGTRHPAKQMAGKKNMDNAQAPVNLIHCDDCIAIITQIIEQNITGDIFNAVSDGHPTRQQYYTKAAEALGLEPPTFNHEKHDKNHKVVSNAKLKDTLSYSFIHPDPLIPS